MKLLLLVNLLLVLVGCNSEYASLSPMNKTRIKVTTSLPTAITADKIMLWGQHPDGSAFGKITQVGEESEFILNNGNYKLYAIAWALPNLNGQVYCKSLTTPLSGPDLEIDLELANENCNESVFRGAFAATIPADLGFVKTEFCESVNGITAATDECSDDLASLSRKQARGHAMSYRFVMKTYEKTKSKYTFKTDEITSACYSGIPNTDLSGLAGGMAVQIPSGDGSTTPFYLTMETFPGSTWCDDSTHGKISSHFANGLIKNSSTTKYVIDGTFHKLYVKMSGSEICNATTMSQTFAGGNGNKNSPFLICNPAQFYNTQTSNTSSFKLMSDIDLKPYYYGVTTLPNIPNGLTCLEKGSNFFPIGYDTGTCSYSGSSFATSDFDGGGKTIRNLKISIPGNDLVGLYTRKYGGEIRRLKFENAYVKGRSYVGLLAGMNATTVRDVVVNTAYIQGNSSIIGGLAGSATTNPNACAFRNILMKKVTVSAALGVVGGVVGDATSCEFFDMSVNAIVSSQSNDTGGIAGQLYNAVMNGVAFDGSVKGNSNVGGIAGVHFDSAVTGVRVVGGVFGTRLDTAANTGGLFGYMLGGTSGSSFVTNSIFFGQVAHQCGDATPANCGVANIVGDAGSWGPADFLTTYYLGTNTVNGYSNTNMGNSRGHASFYDQVTAWPANFTLTGDLPRLNHEINALTTDLRHPCQTTPNALDSVAAQIIAGRGSVTNPISICNWTQMKQMQTNTTHASKAYKLLTGIVAPEPLSFSTMDFSGQLDGDMNVLTRLRVEAPGGFDAAWWRSLTSTAVIKNLYLIDAKIDDWSGTASTTSLIAKTNEGTLDKVYALTVKTVPGNSGEHALLVHTNNGTIKNSYVGGSGEIKSKIATITYRNNGIIEDTSTYNFFYCSWMIDCVNVSGVTIRNDGILRRLDINPVIQDVSAHLNPSNFSFVANSNYGTIEDIHIRGTSRLMSKAYSAHAVAIENFSGGIIRRIYNEGSTIVANGALPALGNTALMGDIDFIDGASSAVGWDWAGNSVTDIIYRFHARWSFPSQHGAPVFTNMGGGVCKIEGNPVLNASWEGAMVDPAKYPRFGLMVNELELPYLLTAAANFTGAKDLFLVSDPTPCSMTVGNPTSYVRPYDYKLGAGLITQAQRYSYATFASFTNAEDITTDTAYHTARYNRLMGTSTAKPVWVFDTSSSLRLDNR